MAQKRNKKTGVLCYCNMKHEMIYFVIIYYTPCTLISSFKFPHAFTFCIEAKELEVFFFFRNSLKLVDELLMMGKHLMPYFINIMRYYSNMGTESMASPLGCMMKTKQEYLQVCVLVN